MMHTVSLPQVKSYAEEQEELELKVRGCYCDSQQT